MSWAVAPQKRKEKRKEKKGKSILCKTIARKKC
jgi:hypothetical protein